MAHFTVNSILFESVSDCNLRCNYCYNCWKAVPRYSRAKLSTRKTIKMLLKLARQTNASQIACTGGEPLLRDDLPDIAAALTLKGINVSVLTNGMLLDPQWAEDLVKTGVKLFQLTLLSMNEELHDYHCGTGSFAGIMRAADILQQHSVQVAISVVVTKKTIDELPGLLEFMHSLGQQRFLLNRFNPGGAAISTKRIGELMLDRQETLTMLGHAQQGANKWKMKPLIAVPIPPCVVDHAQFPALQFAGCAAATDKAYITINPLGDIRMCNHSPVILGNIRKSSFEEIIASPEVDQWLEMKPEFCVSCSLWSSCKGGCRAVAQQMGHPLTTLDPYVAANASSAFHK